MKTRKRFSKVGLERLLHDVEQIRFTHCTCGQKIPIADLFCPYCGEQNEDFSLAEFNREHDLNFINPDDVKAFCKRADLDHAEFRQHAMNFCAYCGKSYPAFVQ